MMKKLLSAHWKYLGYVLRHKKFVYQEGRKLGLGDWQLLTHDWSKFLPDEWFPYVGSFNISRELYADAFDVAWLKHQRRHPHHWQYWVLINDSDEPQVRCLRMPFKYILEMVADWRGASRAITGGDNTLKWYGQHRDQIMLHPVTRVHVEALIGYELDSINLVLAGSHRAYRDFVKRNQYMPKEWVFIYSRHDLLQVDGMAFKSITWVGPWDGNEVAEALMRRDESVQAKFQIGQSRYGVILERKKQK